MRALGIDLGSRRIGLALSNSDGTLATPYEVIERGRDHGSDHREIIDIADELGVECLVVGLPVSLDGTLGPAARSILDEVAELEAVSHIAVETYDERFTTVSAHRSLSEMDVRTPARRKVVDKIAATVFLQAWLDHRALAAHRPTQPEPAQHEEVKP